jgi:glycosyltransferase involved in cell wall biosynthesis
MDLTKDATGQSRTGDPVLSVIVPVYNASDTLEASLDSVLSQNLDDVEVVCVDDGSTDGSGELLRAIAARDGRVRVLSQENAGAGAARNAGMAAARGRYLCFLDPDDLYPDEDVLADLVAGAESCGAAICGGSFSSFHKENPTQIKRTFAPSVWGYVFERNEMVSYADYQFDYGFHRFVYRRSLLQEAHVSFPTWQRFQDPPFFARAMIAAGKFYALARPTYLYCGRSVPMKWTTTTTCEFLRGCAELLDISREAGLERLHALAMARVYENRNEQKGTLPRNSEEAREVLEQLREAARPEFLRESDFVTARQFEDSLRMRLAQGPARRAIRKAKRIAKSVAVKCAAERE